MKTEPNAPINPTIWEDENNPNFVRDNDGLTKREHFAALAMQGILSNQHMGGNGYSFVEIAKWSTDHADALIDALNNTNDKAQQG